MFLSGGCGDKATFKFTQVGGQIQCLVIVRLSPCLFAGYKLRGIPSLQKPSAIPGSRLTSPPKLVNLTL